MKSELDRILALLAKMHVTVTPTLMSALVAYCEASEAFRQATGAGKA